MSIAKSLQKIMRSSQYLRYTPLSQHVRESHDDDFCQPIVPQVCKSEDEMKNLQQQDRSVCAVQLRDLQITKRLSIPAWIIDRRSASRRLVALLAIMVLLLGGVPLMAAAKKKEKIKFDMVPAQATCLRQATAHVTVTSLGPVEEMDVNVSGLPPNTEFDFFVIQVPHGPFGLSWYQGDIETDDEGEGHQRFIGRFSIETFIVAPGIVPAPVVHNQAPFPDANSNPQTAPVHTFHLGLWFNSPADAVKAGCPGATTPFNGDHTAGVQVLNTSNFADDQGPLRQLVP